MSRLSFLTRYIRSKRGATAIEYALIAAGVSLALIGVIFAFGDTVYTLLYEDLPDALNR